VDNDFAGDPDDLFQLAHHMLSPSVEICGILCSHLALGDPFYPGADSADQARRVVERLAEVMAVDLAGRLHTGSNHPLESRSQPRLSDAARFIVAEAMRDEPSLPPLFVVCGGGLTELASAYLMEPRISERLTAIWVGGPEHEGLGQASPGTDEPEYNLRIDIAAAQTVLNDSDLDVWLVPRNVYRQCLASNAELRHRVANRGRLGRHLYGALTDVRSIVARAGLPCGDAYVLGDSPLVLLTALQSFFQPEPSSSESVIRPCPVLDDHGRFTRETGRNVRVFTRLDVRLMLEDLFIKIDEFNNWLRTLALTGEPMVTTPLEMTIPVQ
jgi:hypothetical protein